MLLEKSWANSFNGPWGDSELFVRQPLELVRKSLLVQTKYMIQQAVGVRVIFSLIDREYMSSYFISSLP